MMHIPKTHRHFLQRFRGSLFAIVAVLTSCFIIFSHSENAYAAQTNCFAHPSVCGYPDPTAGNVGATSVCSSLASSGSINASTNGQTIQNLNITGQIVVTASNVTISNVCVTTDGGAQGGSQAIAIISNATNTLIQNATLAGANSTNRSIQEAVSDTSGGATTIRHTYMHNCGECTHYGPFTISDSYIISDGMQPEDTTGEHYEDVYMSDGSISIDHSVLLNPEPQTATVFADTNGGGGGPCTNHITVNNSLLAGGGYMIYPCSASSSAGSSAIIITNNRFARCTTGPVKFNSGSGGANCQNATEVYPADGNVGADQFGYWPSGGYFGVIGGPTGNLTWTGNAWDDNCTATNTNGTSGAANSCPAGTTTPPSNVVGDLTGDGHVNSSDTQTMTATFGKAQGASGYNVAADLKVDSKIDIYDLSILLSNYGT